MESIGEEVGISGSEVVVDDMGQGLRASALKYKVKLFEIQFTCLREAVHIYSPLFPNPRMLASDDLTSNQELVPIVCRGRQENGGCNDSIGIRWAEIINLLLQGIQR